MQVFAIGAVVAAALAWFGITGKTLYDQVNTLNDSVKKAQQQADDLTPKVEKLPEALRQLTGQLKSELAGTTEKLKENASSGGDASQWRTSVSLFG